eukprot:14143189-Alexandrium_andersonii.AAC.1
MVSCPCLPAELRRPPRSPWPPSPAARWPPFRAVPGSASLPGTVDRWSVTLLVPTPLSPWGNTWRSTA